jgi:DNA polymerase/3'-5' exonuclease PolX
VSEQRFLLNSKVHAARLMSHIGQLQYRSGRGFMVTFEPIDLNSIAGQIQRLRGIEREICSHTGHDMEEVHERLLARKHGTKTIELGNGKTMDRPARRSSEMGYQEIVDYIDWVIAIGIEYGVEFSQ